MNNYSRRNFLKSTATVAAGTLILPNLLSSCKNGKLDIAVIGVGGRGEDNWNTILEDNIVALCDVDEQRATNGFVKFPKAKRYKDYRVMFDEMAHKIDAVIISTPDHSHFPATMAAMQLGKHVYCEKPLAHNIWQLRTLKKAAKYYKIVSQMGNQGHTTNGIRLIKEWVDLGLLGQVKEVHAWFGPFDFKPGGYWTKPDSFPPSSQPVPANLDWDLWQGPVAERPYNSAYTPKSWRGFYEYGNGMLGDWACHTLDAPFWALNLGNPLSAEGVVENPRADHSFIPDQSVVNYRFAARGNKVPVTMSWYEGGLKPEIKPEWGIEKLPNTGMLMVGNKMSLLTGGRPNQPRLVISDEKWKSFLENPPAKTIPRVGEEKPQQEWIDAIKNDTLPESNFDYAAELSEMILVGVLAQRFATKIEYDAQNMKITNHPELNTYLKEPVRKGWSFGENL